MMILLVIALSAVVVDRTDASTDNGSCILLDPPKDICKNLPNIHFTNSVITLHNKDCGDQVRDFKEKPQEIHWNGITNITIRYTFLLIGRDSTGDYTFHWGLSNIPGHFLRGIGDITERHNFLELADYVPMTVTHNGTTSHSFAYLALLYSQTRTMSIKLNLKSTERRHFNLKGFAEEQGLCGPLAGQQAYASPDKPSDGSKPSKNKLNAFRLFLEKLSLDFAIYFH